MDEVNRTKSEVERIRREKDRLTLDYARRWRLLDQQEQALLYPPGPPRSVVMKLQDPRRKMPSRGAQEGRER